MSDDIMFEHPHVLSAPLAANKMLRADTINDWMSARHTSQLGQQKLQHKNKTKQNTARNYCEIVNLFHAMKRDVTDDDIPIKH